MLVLLFWANCCEDAKSRVVKAKAKFSVGKAKAKAAAGNVSHLTEAELAQLADGNDGEEVASSAGGDEEEEDSES